MRSLWLLATLFTLPAMAVELFELELKTTLVPSPAQFAVLVPDGYADATEPFPLLLALHGGGGNRDFLKQIRPWIEELWRTGALPKMVVATPTSSARSFYMDFKDGAQKWETFLTGEFLEHLRKNYKVRRDRTGTLLFGISMGGQGVLRLGLKHPQIFGGLAAIEPGIDPVLKWKDIQWRHRFWRSDALMETAFGKPFDAGYWEANNPASIVAADPERMRKADLAIYLECGDEDGFGLDEATEFMHRLLRDQRVPHEYHLVRGADHLGRTVRPRSMEGLAFLGRVANPPPADPVAENFRRTIEEMKKRNPPR